MYSKGWIWLLLFITALNGIESDHPEVKSFVQMVLGNITAARNYITPTDNKKLVELRDTEKMYDYGTFDFVIVGGGSAGTLLANRLSEIKNWKILLLEAGGNENDFSDIPGMMGFLQFSDMNWGYYSVPQTSACLGMQNRRCVVPRGKVIGGSSTINGKMCVRGNKEDYNLWEKMGNKGWSYDNILRYFIKTENSTVHGDPGFHGKNGLLHVEFVERTVFTSSYISAMRELGMEILDYNGRHQIGSSPTAFTINGIKIASGGRAYIDPFLYRKNLNVTLNAFVTKLVISKLTKRARGVEFIKNGKKYTTRALKEVIVSAGVVNSPQILMLSGIGPKEELQRIKVNIVKDLPVGKNMQDHPMFIGLHVRTNQTLFNESTEQLIKNYLNGHRPYTCGANLDSLSFLNIAKYDRTVPDIQHIMLVPPGYGDMTPLAFNLDNKTAKSFNENYNPYTDLIMVVVLLNPKSKGSVTLQSNNPRDFPNFDYNYFTDPENKDIETMYRGVLEALKLLETRAFKAMNASYNPVVKGCDRFVKMSKPYWYCAIRHLTTTIYHPVGTTRMGPCEKESVVTSDLLVHGMDNLRVVDAGVMPQIPSGNTNIPTYMVAEKASDIIKARYKVL